jgi:hypothetical protein
MLRASVALTVAVSCLFGAKMMANAAVLGLDRVTVSWALPHQSVEVEMRKLSEAGIVTVAQAQAGRSLAPVVFQGMEIPVSHTSRGLYDL